MSTSWIKLRTGLYEEPEVVAMAERLQVSAEHVVGLFAKLWGWADDHLSDMIGGRTEMPGAWFDEYVHFVGFVAAAVTCAPHWVVMEGQRVVLRNLDRHNGQGAKTRALESRRKQEARNHDRPKQGTQPKSAAGKQTDDQWLAELARNPVYEGIDVKREYGKAGVWMREHQRSLTRRAFINWLNHAQPLNGGKSEPTTEEWEAAMAREREFRRP